ncbi:MAG: 50S ribosomal protein L25 [Deltaproteobacteria bacterium]|jgi:large subunit ribosomal protein L25|nr:50S ribosomal protein L25 [Deltaproteobacteria bacterium]
MGDVTFAVELRDSRGKGAARKLRQRGMVPGIVYGGGRESTAISLDVSKLERLLETSHGGINTLIDLSGDSAVSGRTVIAKELQREAVRGHITHVDFYEVDLKSKIEVSIPIHLEGTPEGVVLGGVLDQQQRDVTVLCLPDGIPDGIEVDVSGMVLGDSLHISDIQFPADVEVHCDESLTVATVLVPRGLKDGEGEPEAAQGEEAAEDGEDKGEAKAEGDGDGDS